MLIRLFVAGYRLRKFRLKESVQTEEYDNRFGLGRQNRSDMCNMPRP